MKISINMIENSFKNNIAFKNIRETVGMTIEFFKIYDGDNDSISNDILYIIKAEDMIQPEVFPVDSNFLCCKLTDQFNQQACRHINLLVIDDLSEQKILNEIITIFHKFNIFEKHLNSLIHENFSLQKIVDLATEMVEMPLNILDLKHNVLAISSHLDAPDDCLWEVMKAGYDYVNYDMVLEGIPTMSDIIHAPGASVEIISNISKHFIKVSMLFYKGHAVATFGMHKTFDFEKPFEKYTIQIYDYILDKLNQNLNLFFEAKADRGLLYEEFLQDIFSRKFKNYKEIENLLFKLGFKPDMNYLMGLISVCNNQIKTDYYFTMLEYLERIIPDSKSIVMDSLIYIIIPIVENDYLSDITQNNLSEFLSSHNCICLFSPIFNSFEELYKINAMFKIVLEFVQNLDRHDRIYHFYEYANHYSFWLLAENMPRNTIKHPMIQKIVNYDEKHHSNYLETLKCYLRNESKIAVTAKLLHMHRNSLQYRIHRIENLLGVSLDDWKLREQLLFFMID